MTGAALQTGVPLIDWFLVALDEVGYLLVFGFTVFENLFLVGSATPGETVVMGAALVASRGGLMIAGVWVASFFGTALGSNISYWGGRRLGMDAVDSFVRRIARMWVGRLFKVSEESVLDVYEHFHTEGSKTVLISRFAVGAKNIVPAIAGATRMPVFWFELYTLVGAGLYTTAMCVVGWFLGSNLDLALEVMRGIGFAGLVILVIFITVAWQVRKRVKRRRHLQEPGAASSSSEPREGSMVGGASEDERGRADEDA